MVTITAHSRGFPSQCPELPAFRRGSSCMRPFVIDRIVFDQYPLTILSRLGLVTGA